MIDCKLETTKTKQTLSTSTKVNWKKVDKLAYVFKVSEGLQELKKEQPVNSTKSDERNSLIADTVKILNSVAHSCCKRNK